MKKIKIKFKSSYYNDEIKTRIILLDDDDYKKLKNHKLCLSGFKEYAKSNKVGLIHRFIMKCPENKVVDHINGNVHDNRKKNLRICDYSTNLMNRNTKTGKLRYITETYNNNFQLLINNRYVYYSKRFNFLEDAIQTRNNIMQVFFEKKDYDIINKFFLTV